MRSPPIEQLGLNLGYQFSDESLLTCALTHSSYAQENPTESGSNQRLEFLGDAVLQLIVSESLYQIFPVDREGALSQRRSVLSKGKFLSNLAREIGLGECLFLTPAEETNGGRSRASILEDAFEALIGAVYLDSDYDTCRRVVLGIYGSLPERLKRSAPGHNPKGRLQEKVQPKHGNTALRYEVTHVSGEDHNREYEAVAWLLDEVLGTGRGTSKKLAEEAAAEAALQAWDSAAEAP